MLSRIFLSLGLCASMVLAAPTLVNGISFYVNNQPVTLLELYKTAQLANVSKERAMEMLIDKMLHQDEIERYGISTNEIEVNQEVERIAKSNGATLEQFRSFLDQKGVNWESYKEDLKEKVLKDKLYDKIVANNLRMADERELVAYYESNKNLFSIPARIETIKYSSKNQEALVSLLKNPLSQPKGVISEPETILTQKINPKLAALLQETPLGQFTQIFTIGEDHLTFLVKSKGDLVLIPFESAKEAVFHRLMMEKEDKVIREHFEKLRASAKVKVIRLD
ncbi:peptidylprolyl isomerase [Wolinella succinogenes]|uniref:peptidylprolyl isomerase n=1 Tax=Wolinella succinogenes TaxID=844 RepID=UPI0016A2FAB6|nr:peptidylprolyl isomerase [Wolinella succinogenes]NLU35273.1 peptidyl-prolyl cis-trans isomerase [Wolinella succinogenes]